MITGNSNSDGNGNRSGVGAAGTQSSIRSPHSLFISDLHLCEERPHINEMFYRFTRDIAPAAEALYILGDLFEYWVGDDDVDDPLAASVAAALKQISARGVAVYLMLGNRDVMMGEDYARRCGAELIPDPTVVDLYGTRTLLMHGDTLCTDDTEYQKFRQYIHDPRTQAQLRALPLAARHEKARSARSQSETHKANQAMEIMDVNAYAVAEAFQKHAVTRMIHGHTHRPAQHAINSAKGTWMRWVLADWGATCRYLICDSGSNLSFGAVPNGADT